jgi:hypothetical protein
VLKALGRLGPIEVSVLPGIEEKVEFRFPLSWFVCGRHP